jgi:hypothetical protein
MEKMNVQPANGKLGVLCVGLGAVATTFMTGIDGPQRISKTCRFNDSIR